MLDKTKTHVCNCAIVVCIDFRFQEYIRNFTNTYLKNKTFDLIALAGGTKNLKTILKQIDTSVNLHKIKKVILIHHENCGAYGKYSTLENHTKDLKNAKTKILLKHPDLKVNLFYLYLNGKFRQIH